MGKSALFCIVSLYCAVFWNVTPNVKLVYGNCHKVFWKILHEMEVPLKIFQLVQSWALYCN